jgi:hypothetical protein
MKNTLLRLFLILFLSIYSLTSIAQKRSATGFIIDSDDIAYNGTIISNSRQYIPPPINFTADVQGASVEYDNDSLQAIGKSKHKKGYVILNNGDKLWGEVEVAYRKRNPSQFTFKENNSTTSQLMTPENVVEFGFEGFRYVSRNFKYDTRPYNLSRLSRSIDPIFNELHGFLQVLVSGPVELYQFTDNLGQTHFLIGNGDRVDLLLHSRYRTDAMYGTNRENFVLQTNYKATLLYYFNDCKQVGNTDVTKVAYSANSLSDVVYNFGSRCGYEMERNKIKKDRWVNFGVTAGIKTSTLSFSYNNTTSSQLNYPHLIEAKFNNSTNSVVGAFLLVDFPWQNNRWSLYNEIIGTGYDYRGSYQEVNAIGNTVTYSTNINYLSLKLRSFWQLNQPLDRIVLSYGLGLALDGTTSEQKTWIVETLPDNRTKKEQTSIKFNVGFGIAAAVGARYNKWEVRLYYERPNNKTKTQNNLFTNMHEVGLSLNYRFL